MRCYQELNKLCRNVTNISNRAWQSTTIREYSGASSSGDGPSVSGNTADEPIYAACVLQRLPLLRRPVPASQVAYIIQSRQRALQAGELKDYPEGAVAGKADSAAKQQQQDLRQFDPVPSETAADKSGQIGSMRRQLHESLYLVVRSGAGSAGPAEAEASGDGWAFPSAANSEEESISETARRALFASIGRTHPVFFVGAKPMAHLVARPKGKTFFLLAQAVDDPWDIRPPVGAAGMEYAWLTKAELASGGFLRDVRLRELVGKML